MGPVDEGGLQLRLNRHYWNKLLQAIARFPGTCLDHFPGGDWGLRVRLTDEMYEVADEIN